MVLRRYRYLLMQRPGRARCAGSSLRSDGQRDFAGRGKVALTAFGLTRVELLLDFAFVVDPGLAVLTRVATRGIARVAPTGKQ